jgi:hypothetical protein
MGAQDNASKSIQMSLNELLLLLCRELLGADETQIF